MKKILALALFGLTAIVTITAFQAAAQTVNFTINNMTCALCPIAVKGAMEGVEGVRAVKIDFEARSAMVDFDPAVTSTDAIAPASADAGYPALLVASNDD